MYGGSYSSVYDAFNRRVQFVQNSGNTQFAYNPIGKKVSVWQGTSSVPALVESITYWNGKPVSYFDGTGTSFLHYDAFGTNRAQSNYYYIGGYIDGWTSNYTSLPFGDGQGDGYGSSGPGGDVPYFAQLDSDSTSTDHAQFRQYYPVWGRWMSPDPYDGSYDSNNPQSFNRYAYVLNNPMRFIDPTGLKCDGVSSIYDTSGNLIATAPGGCSNRSPGDPDGSDQGGGPIDPTPVVCSGPRLGNCTNVSPVTNSIVAGGRAPNNNNQKNLTTLFETQETVEKLGSTVMVPGAMVTTAGIMTGAGIVAIGAACGGDGPFALATCVPVAGVVGPTVLASDAILLKNAYTFVMTVTIPTWKSIVK
jgi:RHS repeat-associated protein